MSKNILIMGATGTVGSSLIEQLLNHDVILYGATRKPDLAKQTTQSNIEYIYFDLERPETFKTALSKIDSLFMISRPGDDEADTYAEPLIKAVKDSNIQHVVNLSAMGSEDRPDFSTRKVELLLEKSGIPFTHLRPNFFMQLFTTGVLYNSLKKNRNIVLPAADAKLSFVDARDVSKVASKILAYPKEYLNKSYTITGSSAIDHYEVAKCISEASNISISYTPISPEVMQDALKASGMPDSVIMRLLGMYRLVREGRCRPTTNTIEKLTGSQPISFNQFANDHKECWQ